MAVRPVFVPDDEMYVQTVETEFRYHSGFSKAQRQRSAESLHESFLNLVPDAVLLEVSSFSKEDIGIALSAFHLKLGMENGLKTPVELAFQAGKVFERGGPYRDLMRATPNAAKRDPRLAESGRVIRFEFEGESFPTEPPRLFYTWLYLKALSENKELAAELPKYSAFTDIVFNPAKSINCQAFACAFYVSLSQKGEFERAVSDPRFLAGILGKAHSPAASVSVPLAPTKTSNVGEKGKMFPSIFKKYDIIVHPAYGKGVIKKIIKGRTYATLCTEFEGIPEVKQLSENWVRLNCSFESQHDSAPFGSKYEKTEEIHVNGADHYQDRQHPFTEGMKETLRLVRQYFDHSISFAVLGDSVFIALFPDEVSDLNALESTVRKKCGKVLGRHPDFETSSVDGKFFMVIMQNCAICIVLNDTSREELGFWDAMQRREEILNACRKLTIYGFSIGLGEGAVDG